MSARLVKMDLAAGTVVTNTTTKTSFAKHAFPVGTLTPGKVYDFEGGVIVSATNSTDTLAVGVTFGSNALLPASNTAIAASAAVDVADADVAQVRGSIHVQSATRAVLFVQLAEPDAIATITMKNQGPVVFTLVPGTAYYLDLTGTWSVANAGNIAASAGFSVTERT